MAQASRLQIWLSTFLKLIWGVYLLLTSLYCLLAFLPYTYFALIKAPAYVWMPWFAHHQGVLYWAGLLATVVAVGPSRKARENVVLFGALAVGGVYLTVLPFLPGLQNNWAAYRWSLIALLPLMLVAVAEIRRHWPVAAREDSSLLAYFPAVWVAIFVALLYGVGVAVHGHSTNNPLRLDFAQAELTAWSLLSHVLVALIVVSLVNLIGIMAGGARRPAALRLLLYGFLIALTLATTVNHFLVSALTFEGWPAHLYAAFLAVSLTLLLGSTVLPFVRKASAPDAGEAAGVRFRLLPVAIIISLSVFAVALPTLIGGGDWNGVLQSSFTVFFWIALSVCAYILRPVPRNYSLAGILAVLLLAGFTYKMLQTTEILWAKPLGNTDDDVARAMENYAARDVSFSLAHHVLGNSRELPCGDLCRILREYTNIRDAEARTEVKLVDPLVPTTAARPNIFVLVIDSVRPDYLGAYNPRADFTPNLDAFARDSVALRNVYTQYAGTTLSEPAIWSGVMLLHAHYMQPFSRVNGMEKLVKTDGYQMIVSYDTVLSQILDPSDELTKLDTDKRLWSRFEACSTLQQLENTLDARVDKARPVFFYAQPMNVHQFANNNMPGMTAENWHVRHGFDNRIAYELHQADGCVGSFFNYLKSRGLYDNSIIIITSDHGDATGEFGRYSHSLSIFPEVMRVPLIVHLPAAMRGRFAYDDSRVSALTDITPSLYYLLGHRPVRSSPIFGHPLFTETRQELESYRRDELFLASDERAVYGLLTDNGRFLFTTYDFPAQSFLFDLSRDPNAEHSILTKRLEQEYGERIIDELHVVAEFYGYKPGVGSLLAAAH